MTAEIQELYKLYNHYISDSPSEPVESKPRRSTAFHERRWGDPLSLKEFTSRWKSICRDPALKQLWEERLRADSKQDAVGELINRLASAASNELNAAA